MSTRGGLTGAKKCVVTTNCEKSAEVIVPEKTGKCDLTVLVNDRFFDHHRPDGIIPRIQNLRTPPGEISADQKTETTSNSSPG